MRLEKQMKVRLQKSGERLTLAFGFDPAGDRITTHHSVSMAKLAVSLTSMWSPTPGSVK